MRRVALVLVLLLLIVACGDDDTSPATEGTSTPATASAAVTAPTPGPTHAPATTGVLPSGPTDCREIWPEAVVQSVAGEDFTFSSANDDASACVFGLVPGIALAWRTSNPDEFAESRQGAELVSGTSNDAQVCDAGFWVELEGAGIIMESFSASQGRAYTATISGFDADLDVFVAWGIELLGSAC